jgi:hypothetical protein
MIEMRKGKDLKSPTYKMSERNKSKRLWSTQIIKQKRNKRERERERVKCWNRYKLLSDRRRRQNNYTKSAFKGLDWIVK